MIVRQPDDSFVNLLERSSVMMDITSIKDVVGVLTDIVLTALSVATYYRNNKKEDSFKKPTKPNES